MSLAVCDKGRAPVPVDDAHPHTVNKATIPAIPDKVHIRFSFQRKVSDDILAEIQRRANNNKKTSHLPEDLRFREVLIIWPKSTHLSAEKRERALTRLKSAGKDRHSWKSRGSCDLCCQRN